MSVTEYDRAKQAAGTAHTLAIVAFAVIAVTLAVSYGVAVYRALDATPDDSLRERISAAMTILVPVLPVILFMSALSRLRSALHDYEQGAFFSPGSARAVRKAGEDAFLGMLAQILIVPTILAWIGGAKQIDTRFELTDLALLAFVLFIAAVGRILGLAATIKAENDQIV